MHAHLQLDDRHPFKVGLRDRCRLLAAPPFQLPTRHVSVCHHCELYLERTFYNLTAVAAGAARLTHVRRDARQLARHKYGLETAKPHLLGYTLEQGQGLDVLEVMRIIHVFVAHYGYNLTNQVFVERRNNKHLKAQHARDIARGQLDLHARHRHHEHPSTSPTSPCPTS